MNRLWPQTGTCVGGDSGRYIQCLNSFPRFALYLASGLCTSLHVSSRHDVDRICNTADHLMHRSHFGIAQLWIFVLSDEFCSYFINFVGFLDSQMDRCELFGEVRECKDVQVFAQSNDHRIFSPDKNVPCLSQKQNVSQKNVNSVFTRRFHFCWPLLLRDSGNLVLYV